MIWGIGWDRLLAKDTTGMLLKRMEECVDGEYQDFKSKNGAYVREHFFGKYPELKAMVADMSDDEIWALTRGGHDPHKVYAAYAAAVKHKGQPTVILAKTVKGYGMGEAGEGQNITHPAEEDGRGRICASSATASACRSPTSSSGEVPFLRFAEDSAESCAIYGSGVPRWAASCRHGAGSRSRCKSRRSRPLTSQLKSTGEREISTTMAFVRILNTLMRDKAIGKRVVPIVPDESRTFGMEGMFRQFGIFCQVGQLYRPEDANQLMFYKEDKNGPDPAGGHQRARRDVFLDRGCDLLQQQSNVPMIPFYIYYSMFGFQRIGDLAWAAGDMRARGFLIGGDGRPHDAERRRAAARGRA